MQGAQGQGQGQGITALDVAATMGTLVGICFFNPGAGWFDVGNTIAPLVLMVTAPSFAQNQTVRQGHLVLVSCWGRYMALVKVRQNQLIKRLSLEILNPIPIYLPLIISGAHHGREKATTRYGKRRRRFAFY